MFSIFCDHVEILPGEEYAGLADWSVVVVSVCPSLPSKVLMMNIRYQNIFHSCCIVVVCGDICFDCKGLFIFFIWTCWQLPEDSDRGFVFGARLPQLWSSHLQPAGKMVFPQNRENIFIKSAPLFPDLIITLIALTHYLSLSSSEWRYYYIWHKPALELPDLLITLIAAVFLQFLHLPLKV